MLLSPRTARRVLEHSLTLRQVRLHLEREARSTPIADVIVERHFCSKLWSREMIMVLLTNLTLQDPPRDYRQEALGQFAPMVVLEIAPSLRLNGEVLSVYAPFTGPRSKPERLLAMRRVITGRDAPSTEEWVIASECPGAEEVLLELESLPPPMVDVPIIGRDDQQGPTVDGTSFRLFARYPTWPNAFAYEIDYTTNVGTPLARWAIRLKSTLEPCWTRSRPSAWGESNDQTRDR